MDEVVKTSRIIQGILKVLFWVIAVVSVAVLVAAVVALFVQDDSMMIDGIVVTLGGFELLLSQAYSLQQLTPMLYAVLINVALFGAVACYTIRVLLTMFEPMAQGRPFNEAVSAALKKLAHVVLAFGIAGIILQIVTGFAVSNTFDIQSLFGAGSVESVSMVAVSDGSFIIWFFVLRLFSHIFKYGETLQQLSDETL